MATGMRLVLIAFAAMLVVSGPPSLAQDMTINLNPSITSDTPCGDLLTGFDFPEGSNLEVAMKSAAEGGYRLGYAFGYLHGVLDDGEKKWPLSNEEIETFVGTYQLLCQENSELSVYEAARDSMSFQTR